MGSSSSIMRPQELFEFRKLNTGVESVEIPARPESRTVTDKKGFVIYGVAVLILLPFLIYTLVKCDFRHLRYNYDECGNFCGYNNTKVSDIPCSGKDFRGKEYLDGSECVAVCSSGHSIGGVCYDPQKTDDYMRRLDRFQRDTDDEEELRRLFESHWGSKSQDDESKIREGLIISERDWWKYIVTILVAIVVSIFTLILLRYLPSIVIWGIILLCMIFIILITGLMWFFYLTVTSDDDRLRSNRENSAKSVLLVILIIITIIALIILIVFVALFKKIGLVVQLYKETTKALGAMPLLVSIPILMAFFEVIVWGVAVVTTICMTLSSRDLVKIAEEKYDYELNGVMIFTIIYNVIIAVWTLKLLAGIQFMIISGSVSHWYFARNKDYLDSPICTSFKITMKYHLGTICFGSFLLTLFCGVKFILRMFCRNPCCRCLIAMCCQNVEMILKFLSENSYIETGIHGQSYLRSAKRAVKLLLTNAASLIAINCVGDFVLGIIILLVSIVATGISYVMFMSYGAAAALPTMICFIINLIIVCIVFATFQTIIDTLFICFCEDSILNDGISRPYFMSTGLMEFIENSKKMYGGDTGRWVIPNQ